MYYELFLSSNEADFAGIVKRTTSKKSNEVAAKKSHKYEIK